ncbi:hypothetical protein SAMN05421736_101564 [Evansella caseinilytica]|uniref:Uncharacterized protein n=1 Tax=Evansella caseinilytica TaxID=1503961 RepID=A0A1H3HNY5_9BACI|nr:hypothetical protein [Evansella caseinilytica]SDY17211.1 hypothetical protein SAMN05421736_101564 [Evansella caseinilytica]
MKPKYKKRTLLSTDDQIIQLKQKIIHYQSETQKYKQQVQKLNEKLKEVHIQAPATNSPAIVEEEKKSNPCSRSFRDGGNSVLQLLCLSSKASGRQRGRECDTNRR